MTIGKCKHGEFELEKGCPQCVADREKREGNPPESIAEGIKAARQKKVKPFIVKVRYYSETTEGISPREYTYYSVDRLKVGDIIIVPVKDTTGKAKVSSIDVPEGEVASFKDKVKTIPSGSVVIEKKTLDQLEMEAEASSEATALTTRPGADVEVLSYYTEATKLQKYAQSRVITTLEHVKEATADLSIISNLKKAMEAKKKEYLEPLKVKTEAIRGTYNFLMAPVFEADKVTRTKMLEYNKEQARIRAEQEAINQKRMEAAQAEMKLKGKLTEDVNLVEVAPEVSKTTRTGLGTASLTANWKYEVADFALLPDEYKVPDTAMLNAIARKHHDQKQIPGVRFYNEPTISVRTQLVQIDQELRDDFITIKGKGE